HVLQDYGTGTAQICKIESSDVHPVEENLAFLNVVETSEQAGGCCLACTCVPDNRHGLAGIHMERDFHQHPILIVVRNPYVRQLDFPSRVCSRNYGFRSVDN